MENEFIPYEQALALKELGFDESCAMYWRPEMDGSMHLFCHSEPYFWDAIGSNNSDNAEWVTCTAPLYQQAFRWFREKYGYYISVFRTHDGNWGTDLWLLGVHKPKATVFGETYEEAELACLIKLIEIVKNNL